MSRPLRRLLILALVVVFAVKLITALGATGPITFGDEYLYVANARILLGGEGVYLPPYYPPLYSVVIAPALWFGDRFYEALLVINVLVSSLVLWPAWSIARRFVGVTWALGLLLAVSLLPLHFVYAQLVFSENLFVAVFLFVVHCFLRSLEEKRVHLSLCCGLAIGCCVLTRHGGFLIPPVLVAVWVGSAVLAVRRWGERAGPWVAHGLIVTATAALTWSPWLLAARASGWPWNRVFGLDANPSVEGWDPAIPFLAWVLLYALYLVLMIAPIVAVVVFSGVRRWRGNEQPPERRERALTLLTLLLTASYLLVAARHSWSVYYNAELPQYILGRYLVHLLPLWLVWAFVAFDRISARDTTAPGSRFELPLSAILTVALIAVAYSGVIRGDLVEVAPWFVMFHNGLDAQVFTAGLAVPIAAAAAGVVLLLVMRVIPRAARVVFLSIVCGFYAFASTHDEGTIPDAGQHGRELARVVRERELLDPGAYRLRIINALATHRYDSGSLRFSLKFWGLHSRAFQVAETRSGADTSPELILSDAPLADESLELVRRYADRFHLYLRSAPANLEGE